MIVREPGRNRWVVIDQAVIRNPRLSHRARGILCLLLSMPDNWQVNADWLADQGTEGRDAVRAALNELETAGHMIRHKAQNQQGRWYTRWVVYEQPVHARVDNTATEAGFPGVGFPGAIRSTKEEVLTHLVRDMVTETTPQLCTTCSGNRFVLDQYNHIHRCHTCEGEGLAN